MSQVIIQKINSEQLLDKRVSEWPVWKKEVSVFSWSYDANEECWIIEGEVEIAAGPEKYRVVAGDFVTFKKGLNCTWNILSDVKKHYNFP